MTFLDLDSNLHRSANLLMPRGGYMLFAFVAVICGSLLAFFT